MSAGKTRRNPTKKRSLHVVNEHFEEDSNAVLSSAIVFQQPANAKAGTRPQSEGISIVLTPIACASQRPVLTENLGWDIAFRSSKCGKGVMVCQEANLHIILWCIECLPDAAFAQSRRRAGFASGELGGRMSARTLRSIAHRCISRDNMSIFQHVPLPSSGSHSYRLLAMVHKLSYQPPSSWGRSIPDSSRISGNMTTSRSDSASVSNATIRSTPIPHPDMGGMPCSIAVRKA